MFKDRSAVGPETLQERELAPRSGGYHDGEGWQRYEGGLDTLLSQPAKKKYLVDRTLVPRKTFLNRLSIPIQTCVVMPSF